MPTTVLVMVDGLRPDALAMARCPHFDNLQARSSYTLQASSVMPSVTLPCHMSIFHSVPPARHGITTNEWQPMARPLPGLIDQARTADLHTAAFYNWEPLRNLSLPGSLNFSYFRDNVYADLDADRVIADEAVNYIHDDAPDFAFVYFGTVDTIGHRSGWLSDEYLAQVERVDGASGTLLAELPADSTILLLSDHGGHERNHGTDAAEDMTIPWLVAGPGIRRGYEITAPVTLLDTAPTLARILGIAPHREWEGQCVAEIFTA
ncbi:MAG TPA: alkaline phosphatase family protein [Anaerolineae bacterium]